MSVPLSKLGDQATIIMGQSPPGESYNKERAGLPLLNGPTEFGPIHPTEKQWTTEPTKLCEPGDALFCVRGATAGRLNVADKTYCLGRGLAAIRSKPGKFDAGFLLHILRNGYAKFQARGVGSTFINISSEELSKFEVPALPLEEQRRIAGILDRAEELRAKRNATLAARRALTESLLSRLLGEAERRQWPVKCLADVCERIFDVDHKMPDEVPDGLPFISARDLTDDGISFANAKRISVDDFRNLARKGQPRRGDIVFSRYGTIGKTCMVDGDVEFLASYSCCTIRPNQAVAHPLFLSSYLGSPRVLRQAVHETRGIAIPDLGLKQIKEFSIIVPPIEAQVTFANVLLQLAACFSAMSRSLILLDSMITCLQSKAFRGEL